jgi:acetate kinase
MNNILVLNCGSSSVKYQLIKMPSGTVIAKGLLERVGKEDGIVNHQRPGSDKYKNVEPISDHSSAISRVINLLTDPQVGIIKNMDEIIAVGHRVVHGAEKFNHSVLITDEVMEQIRECVPLAPLHNPANIKGIEAIQKIMPGKPNVAVFDTAFHSHMPRTSYLYALPMEMYSKHGIRRYGFHGTSHLYVSHRCAELLGKDIKDLKIITCHLGNGCSMAAVKDGISMDTSMGYTPLEGLVMGTRSGDIDPAIVFDCIDRLGMTSDEVNNMLNKKSGILGLSGKSNDMREVENGVIAGNPDDIFIFKLVAYRIKKYIGAYAAAMGGVDAIVFTAGIGENSPILREYILEDMDFLGIVLDKPKNMGLPRGGEADVSLPESNVRVLVIPTNEELVIATDTYRIVMGK